MITMVDAIAEVFDRSGLPDRVRVRRSSGPLRVDDVYAWDPESEVYRGPTELCLLPSFVRRSWRVLFMEAP